MIANFYDIYNNYNEFVKSNKISNYDLLNNFEKILTLMMPVVPHFATECLVMLKPKLNLENISWPNCDKALIEKSDCNIVIQVNGKKRSLIVVPINCNEKLIAKRAKLEANVKKYLINNDIIAIPTETVYGLAGNAYSNESVKKIFIINFYFISEKVGEIIHFVG